MANENKTSSTLVKARVDNPIARILAVDDETIVLDSFRKILTEAGYSVDTVEGGPEALELIKTNDYELIYTDMRMPEMDGLEVIEQAQKLRPDIDVVMITGYSTLRTAINALRLGALDYVVKPFTEEELIGFTERVLEKRRQKQLEEERKAAPPESFMEWLIPQITFWRVIWVVIMLLGLYATYRRVFYGLGGSTNLTNEFPWGIWIAFDLLCGVALAAGGFVLCAGVFIFNLKKYQVIVRSTVLTAFLGYAFVVFALLYDLGLPYRIWHPMIMWNPTSVMFEVGWCVMLYTTVLALEFSVVVFERFGLHQALRIVHFFQIPIVTAGILLSMLHQSSLGSLFLAMPSKMHPLWYTSWLPVLFFATAVYIGMAMTLVESGLSARHLGHSLKLDVLNGMGRAMVVAGAFVFVIRVEDPIARGVFHMAFDGSFEGNLFLLELLCVLVPTVLLASKRIRHSFNGLYISALIAVLGLVLYRVDVGITSLQAMTTATYFPSFWEVCVSMMVVCIGITVFRLAVWFFPVFEAAPEPVALEEDVTGVVARRQREQEAH